MGVCSIVPEWGHSAMQRLMTWIVGCVLLGTMVLNVVLGVYVVQLRRQVAALPTVAPVQPDTARLDQLQQQLERSEKDRIKATRDATALREQLSRLGAAAQERDVLKNQLQQLQQEADQLRQQITNLQAMNVINDQMVVLRGLTPRARIPRVFMTRAELRDYLLAESSYTADDERRERAILQALDMDDGSDLRASQIDTLAKSILGFYDHETKDLVIVTDRATMGVSDRVTYAHEFTHSLQDQAYDLGALFARAKGNTDYSTAIRALVEGDATMSMGLYARAHLSAMDLATYQLEQIQNVDLSGLMGAGVGGPLVESAMAFPYTDGASFVDALYQQGGWRAVDAAFARPPRSTEQVLHVESFLRNDEPVVLRLPNVAAGGWQVVTEDTLGELYLRIYLERYVPLTEALWAAKGWGGDRYQVLRDGQGRVALVLQTAWDSSFAAQRFFQSYRAFVAARGGGAPQIVSGDEDHGRWQLADRHYYAARVGQQVLIVHAPDAGVLDALLAPFGSFFVSR